MLDFLYIGPFLGIGREGRDDWRVSTDGNRAEIEGFLGFNGENHSILTLLNCISSAKLTISKFDMTSHSPSTEKGEFPCLLYVISVDFTKYVFYISSILSWNSERFIDKNDILR